MSLLGAANTLKNASGLEPLPGTSNYLVGNDPSKWHTSVPSFGKVEYGKVYPGVDLIYYGNQKQLEFDFVVQPGADTSAIGFKVDGTSKGGDVRLGINEAGDLTADGKGILLHKPVLYQTDAGQKRHLVDGSFVLAGTNEVRFRIGEYDRSRQLTIDPTLAYSTYFGGPGDESAYGIGVDAQGNAYVLGYCDFGQSGVPTTPGAYETKTKTPGYGLFVTKFNQDGSALVYSTYLTDSQGYAQPGSIAVSKAGNAYIPGQAYNMAGAYSSTFPTTPGAYQRKFSDPSARFVTELNTSGTGLVYSTFLSDSGEQFQTPGNVIALDEAGNAYVAGTTYANGFPVTPGVFRTGPINNNQDVAFITKLNPQGSDLVYSALVAGGGVVLQGMAIDASHNIYLTGFTENYPDFPVTPGAYLTVPPHNGLVPFIMKINPTASAVVYSTFFQGLPQAIAADSAGSAYVTGSTSSYSMVPTTPGAFETTTGCNLLCYPAFVTKFNPTGTALVYSTLLAGGSRFLSTGEAIVVNSAGEAYISGETSDPKFPVTAEAFQKVTTDDHSLNTDISDDFLTRLNATGTGLVYSTRIGGNGYDMNRFVALDSSGNAYMQGRSVQADVDHTPKNYPTTPGAYQTTWPNSYRPTPEGEAYELGAMTISKFSFGIPFCSFAPVVEAAVNRSTEDSFVLAANFSPGAGGTIDPINESVTITVGPSSVIIPKNSFVKDGAGYSYHGTINGVSIVTAITGAGPYTIPSNGSTPTPVAATGGCSKGKYILAATGRGAILTGLTNPVTVTVSIGDDSGTQKVNALIEQ
ncbi:SBBP repeat-containing protein [Granulicella sibirica]|uniref:Cell surface protein n=1 Tax=Granulicella sibirica TaxID=2479048 RepID=A0A4V1L6E1_9BACT|nr:SBBP repeat-containing protein [Granulicella sibirica]RXH58944.1 Cell surface protein [Granulicella sibirica]